MFNEDHDVATEVDWMSQGACLYEDPELFFPGPDSYIKSYKYGKRICKTMCPVKDQCLEYAITAKINTPNGDTNYVAGIWGGTTQAERDRLRGLRGIRSDRGRPLGESATLTPMELRMRERDYEEVSDRLDQLPCGSNADRGGESGGGDSDFLLDDEF